MRPPDDLDQLFEGVRACDRVSLGRAITLIESGRDDRRELGQELLARLLPRTGGAIRVGITGVPGVGKSTFIEALGTRLCAVGKRVAVLAVDPSSSLSGGSILGDKSRMERLALDPLAFVRPSPSANHLGGVATRTHETLLLCEAAGHDVVLVETVGVGQSETRVSEMVDFFLVLMLPGGGDELQGIKKGLVELADAILVHKADGAALEQARATAGEYGAALGYLRPKNGSWKPRALLGSSLDGTGIEEVWETVLEHREVLERAGGLAALRQEQRLAWMDRLIQEGLQRLFAAHVGVSNSLEETRGKVKAGILTPAQGASAILGLYTDPAQEREAR